jgi:methylmalonyl-CoA mutase
VVTAAVQEDVQGVALSSYQGGHVEYFTYLKERLAEVGRGHVQVFGGGGGVIVADEIALLAERGVKIFAPEDGQRLGPRRHDQRADRRVRRRPGRDRARTWSRCWRVTRRRWRGRSRCWRTAGTPLAAAVREAAEQRSVPVLGITGTGGSGKSSLTDELVRRFRLDQEDKLRSRCWRSDPTRRKGGGALLGDRIRMNAIDDRDPVAGVLPVAGDPPARRAAARAPR